jgi:hypothetical protein
MLLAASGTHPDPPHHYEDDVTTRSCRGQGVEDATELLETSARSGSPGQRVEPRGLRRSCGDQAVGGRRDVVLVEMPSLSGPGLRRSAVPALRHDPDCLGRLIRVVGAWQFQKARRSVLASRRERSSQDTEGDACGA